jgi:hypothetical protein
MTFTAKVRSRLISALEVVLMLVGTIMEGLKRLKFIFFIVVIFAFTGCKGGFMGNSVEIAKAIPNHVIFIVKVNNLATLDTTLAQRPYEKAIRDNSWLNKIEQNHLAFSEVLKKLIAADASNFPMVSSLHLAKATELNSIHYYPLELSQKEYKRIIEAEYPSAAMQKWNYENAEFTEVLIPESNTKMALVYTGGILIASPESFLVEDAVKQMHSADGLLSDSEFKKVHNKEGQDSDLTIWFNLKNFDRWTPVFANPEGTEQLAKANQFASWMLLDTYFNDGEIIMTGITAAAGKDVLSFTKNKANCTHQMAEVLPVNTALHSHFAAFPDTLTSFKNGAGIQSCWSKVLIEPLKKSEINQWVCIFEQNGKDKINTEKVELLGAKLLGSDKVFSVTEGKFIFVAKQKSVVDNFHSSYKKQQVLSGDETYMALNENLESESNLSLYVRSAYTKEAFKTIYQDQENFTVAFDALKGFNQIAMQFSHEGDVFKTTAHFTYNEKEVSGHTNAVWAAELEAPLIGNPQIITIQADGTKGVLAQDEKFKLYLIGKDGEVIWKKKLDSKWLGKASALKLYDDNAVQMTFNTELSWHLVDETGKDMAGFPLRFKEKAITGMTVARMDGKQVVFIGLENKNLYGYEISGKPLSGWNPKTNIGTLNHSVDVVNQEGKSYVVTHADAGKVTIWSSTGKELAAHNFNSTFTHPFFMDTKAVPFKVKNVKSDGELVSFNLDKRVGEYQLSTSSSSQFKMANVQGNDEPEIIVSDGKTIYYYSYSGNLLYESATSGYFQVIEEEKDKKAHIIVLDPTTNKFTLLGDKGAPVSEPDLLVNSLLDFGHLIGPEQTNLVTKGEGNELNCYRISISEE